LLRDSKRLAILEGYRNTVFHYGSSYIDSRQEKLFKEPNFVQWVWALHDAISDFFLRDEADGKHRRWAERPMLQKS
jgi:hypothetical protein